MDDVAIRALVTRLARPHHSGGDVIERAAILAEGTDSAAILTWIANHAGEPEAVAAPASMRGLHDRGGDEPRTPLRYVMPAGAL